MDPNFQTMRHSFEQGQPISYWQVKCHFNNELDMLPSEGDSQHATQVRETLSPMQTESEPANKTPDTPLEAQLPQEMTSPLTHRE